MALCIHCKAEETELYENGSPICLSCAKLRKFKPLDLQGIQVTLVEALAKATLRADAACNEFTAISSDIPSGMPHRDGVQRIHNASRKLNTARDEMMIAHTRLNDPSNAGLCRKT